MKKLFVIAASAVALSFGACDNAGSDNAAAGQIVPQSKVDSITEIFGKMAGVQVASMFDQAMTQDSTLSKADFIRGMQYALAADTASAYNYGMNIGMNFKNQVKQFAQMGVNVDEARMLAFFKEAFLADTVDAAAAQLYQQTYQGLMGEVRKAKKAADDARKAQEPEALANIKAGEEYIAAQKAKDPEIKTTASGLSYKIINPGEDPKPGESDRVLLNYKGSDIEGRVFDQTTGEPRVMPLGALVEGMKEGLQLIGKGGKATFYIPGNLAYGVDGSPRANIGPLQMLVFDVEIVSIPSKENTGK